MTPSRFYAKPAEIDAFLREYFAEDVLLDYQRAIGAAAVDEAAEQQRNANPDRSPEFSDGVEWAVGHISPAIEAGPYPRRLVRFA